MRIRRIGIGLIAAGLAVLSAPVVAQAQDAQQPKVLRVAVTGTIATMNPFTAYHLGDTEIGRVMYAFLTSYSRQDFSPQPGLADKWSTSPDKLTWTFHIRSGMKWSDGQPITAKDVAWTFNKIMTDKAAATANGSFVTNFDTVTAPDDSDVVIKTKLPLATMLALDVPIVPEHVWAGVTDIAKYDNLQYPVVGSGPFTLTNFTQGQSITLKANPDYYGDTPAYDQLEFRHYDNEDAAVQGLKNGDVDVVSGLTPAQYTALQSTPNVTVVKSRQGRDHDLIINYQAQTNTRQPVGDGNPVLKDPKVRQAIAQSVDVKTLVDKAYGGLAEPGSGYIPAVFGEFHWSPDASQEQKFDLAAAGKLLDEAGYPKGADGVRVGKDGKPINLRLLVDNSIPQQVSAAQFIQGWLKQDGLGVTVQAVSSDAVTDAGSAGKYDLQINAWTGNPDPDAMLAPQTCANLPDADGNGVTENFMCDGQIDSLYKAQQSELDPAKRVQDVKDLQARLYSLDSSIVFAYPNALEAYRSDRWASFGLQPAQDGSITHQNGYYGYLLAKPVAAGSSGGGANTGLIIGIVVVVVVVLGGGAFLLSRRRRAGADERE
ncbi:ABC transporter substrate-binding protein [Kutzneria sp. CA-103260]|uniref:ABC transporter substrate-binding protein n=1 Tax=Kutzneria sp. CA-103260 TaxID=2802641 RepID=UPI001BA95500|nr:ABC transporter substrate-binding protein [Kutzneria sp. CA-103260]QUQ64818.1 ABC transporter substrate-binding protein [Kutzneria sp. CA-103260]